MVDLRGHGPKYLQIADELRRRIQAGELGPGAQLPPQSELAKEFDVTVMTLRQGLAQLEADGLIWSSRGRGTFVADDPIEMPIGNLTSFVDQMRAQGLTVDTEVTGIVRQPPSDSEVDEVRVALAAGPGAVVEIGRVRSVRGRPVVWQRTWLTASLADRIELAELATASLYDLIESAVGYSVARAAERISAVALEAESADRLRRAPGEPALLSVRTSFTVDNTPFLHDRAVLVGDLAAINAERTIDRLALRFTVDGDRV